MKLVPLLGIMALLFAGCGKHLKDAALQASFQRNYLALSNIVTELKSVPKIERVEWDGAAIIVGNTQTNPPALTPKLVPHFKAIGQPLLVTSAGDASQVWFYFSRRGLSVSGSMKGIIYQETLPNRIVQDTDASSRTNAPFTVFRPLQTNWFIFYSR
jgi:hypothetical protein